MINLGNILILGDSYSTFEGHIPSGYAFWYSENGGPETDVRLVEQTWWHRLLRHTSASLLLNCSYSGTTICNTGYDGTDYSEISFIGRWDTLVESGFFDSHAVNTVFVFGGTNDSWANSPVGQVMYENCTKRDLFYVLPAVCYLMQRIRNVLPNARVICIINTDLKQCISENMKSISLAYGAEVIELTDIDKMNGHPSALGMEQIEKQILTYLKKGI